MAYADPIIALTNIIQDNLSGYKVVSVYGKDYQQVLASKGMPDNVAILSYDGGNVNDHYVDELIANYNEQITIYLKTSYDVETETLVTKIKEFITVIDENNRYDETLIGSRKISINSWSILEDNNNDVVQFDLEIN